MTDPPDRAALASAKTLVPERERVSLGKSADAALTEVPLEPRYRDVSPIGEGGMGDVRLVRDLVVGRDVAMKWIRRVLEQDAFTRERFLREAKVQGQLEHPSIVPVYDLGLAPGGRPFFTMRRVRGRTLDACTTGPAALAAHAVLSAMSRVCLAIDFAHTHGVLHRDLKPANLMIGDYGEVYVLDWGLAKLQGDAGDDAQREEDEAKRAAGPNRARRTHTEEPPRPPSGSQRTTIGSVLGTPGYMPPEQATGAEVDERSDIFALGACLFELLAGEPLIPGNDAQVLIASTLAGVDARFSVRVPARDVPIEIEEVCVRATRAAPNERFATVREMSDAIERFLEGDRDVERRKARAREHARAAEELADAALGASADDAKASPRARADAMREVGRALAYDPENAVARRVMVRLLTEPPKAPPPDVVAQMAAERERSIEGARRLAALGFLSTMVPSVIVFWMGVRSWLWFGAGMTSAVVGALVAALPNRAGFLRERRFVVVALGAFGLVANSRLAGPFVVVPVAAMGLSVGLALFPRRTPVWVAIVAGALCVLAPLALEWAGVLPRTMRYESDHLETTAQLASFREVPTVVYLLLATVMPMAVTCLYLVRIRDRLAAAEKRLRLQAWQLRQILPEVETKQDFLQ